MNCAICSQLADPKLTSLMSDETCVALLSPTPQAPGHIMVVPRAHVADIFACDEATWLAMSSMARSVAQLVAKELSVTSVNIMHGSGPLADEHSPHVTLHVVPRTKKSEVLAHQAHKPTSHA